MQSEIQAILPFWKYDLACSFVLEVPACQGYSVESLAGLDRRVTEWTPNSGEKLRSTPVLSNAVTTSHLWLLTFK